MLKITATRCFIVAAISLTSVFAASGQVPLWLEKMESVKLFKDKLADRDRIFGKPEDVSEGNVDTTYYFDDGYIFVLSVDEVCSQHNKDYPGDVAENQAIVGELRLYIYDDHKITLSSLGLSVDGYRTQEEINERTGVKYKVFGSDSERRLYTVDSKGFVDSIVLFADRQEIARTCK